MVNSVSNMSSMGQTQFSGASQPEQYYSANQYEMQTASYPQKKHTVLGFLGKLILTAAVIGGGSIAARKFIPAIKDYKVIEKMADDAKPMEKIKNTFVKWTDKLYDNTVDKVIKFIKKDTPKTQKNTEDATSKKKIDADFVCDAVDTAGTALFLAAI